MVKHQIQVNVTKAGRTSESIMTCNRITIKDKVLKALFGQKRQFMVLIPSDSVESVSIKEVETKAVHSG